MTDTKTEIAVYRGPDRAGLTAESDCHAQHSMLVMAIALHRLAVSHPGTGCDGIRPRGWGLRNQLA